jgi:hypothetical protein
MAADIILDENHSQLVERLVIKYGAHGDMKIVKDVTHSKAS